MGLTISFALRAPTGTGEAGAAKLVRKMHEIACRFESNGQVDRVGPMRAASSGMFGLSEYLIVKVPGDPDASRGIEVPPEQGRIFSVTFGQGCEPFILGLCRYPTQVRDHATGRPRIVRRHGWRIAGSCKTQYASLHGWEHFHRCHTAAVNLLLAIRGPRIRVNIRDEGGYWPGCDEASLRRSVERMNRIVAGMAGAMRDAADEDGGTPVHSPIFAHPDFERIEAEGVSKEGAALESAVEQLRKLTRDGDSAR